MRAIWETTDEPGGGGEGDEGGAGGGTDTPEPNDE